MKKAKTHETHEEVVQRKLRNDKEFALEYLQAAIEETEDIGAVLVALRRIAESQGGMASIAKSAGLQRESLYRALSPKGNPTLSTLRAVAHALGLQFTFKRANAA